MKTTSLLFPRSNLDGAFQMNRWVFALRVTVYRLAWQLTPLPLPKFPFMSLPMSSKAPFDAVSIALPLHVTDKTCRAPGLKDAAEMASSWDITRSGLVSSPFGASFTFGAAHASRKVIELSFRGTP